MPACLLACLPACSSMSSWSSQLKATDAGARAPSAKAKCAARVRFIAVLPTEIPCTPLNSASRNLDATTSFGFPLVPVLVCVCLLACLPACLPAWCACSTRSTPLHFSTPLHSTPCTPLLLACLPACMLAYTCLYKEPLVCVLDLDFHTRIHTHLEHGGLEDTVVEKWHIAHITLRLDFRGVLVEDRV